MDELKQKTILLVEDEFILAASKKRFLEKYGYKVVTTTTGEKAIEILSEKNGIELALALDSKKAPLETFGYNVILAKSAEQAVSIVTENQAIDIVLMDIDLGEGMDGTQTAEIILQQIDIPILFLSSHTEPEIVEKTEKISSYGYVVKNSGITVLDASIKMAFKLFDAKSLAKKELIERKKKEDLLHVSEIRYRRLFETSEEGILILDAETGMIVDVNPFLINLLGYSHEMFMGKTIWDIGFLKDIIGNKDKFIELQASNYARYENLPLETIKGKVIDVEFISNTYFVENTKVIQCSIRDISERKIKSEIINDLLIEKDIILKEVQNRVKNNMSVMMGILTLQANAQEDNTTKALLMDAAGRIKSMSTVYDKLYKSENANEMNIKDFIPPLVDDLVSVYFSTIQLNTDIKIDDFMVNVKDLSPIGIVINELITNSMKYAFNKIDNAQISISANKKDNIATIIYSDNGVGLPESITFENSTGFGMQLIRTLIKQIKGSIKIERDKGTRFIIEFEV